MSEMAATSPDDNDKRIQVLADRLKEAVIYWSGGKLLPFSEILHILQPEGYPQMLENIISGYLSRHSNTRQKVAISKCFGSKGIRIFAGLLLADSLPLLVDFFEADLGDDAVLNHLLQHNNGVRETIKDEGNKIKRHQIIEWLRCINVPVLAESEDEKQYHSTTALPFLSKQDLDGSRQGKNGILSEVVIPTEYAGLSDSVNDCPPDFRPTWTSSSLLDQDHIHVVRITLIRKKLDINKASERELECLRLCRKEGQVGLARLHLAYKFNKKRYFLFPKYSETLKEYMTRDEDIWDERHLCFAMADIFHGLEHIHQIGMKDGDNGFIGCHNDLKPDNIMFYADDSDRPRLVLIDFGLMTLRMAEEGSEDVAHELGNVYLPPEAYCASYRKSSGPKRDIWSSGCILAEALVHAVEKETSSVADFKAQRRRDGQDEDAYFFSKSSRDATCRLRPAVEQRFQEISTSSPHWNHVDEVLQLLRKILNAAQPSKRPRAEAIGNELKRIANLPRYESLPATNHAEASSSASTAIQADTDRSTVQDDSSCMVQQSSNLCSSKRAAEATEVRTVVKAVAHLMEASQVTSFKQLSYWLRADHLRLASDQGRAKSLWSYQIQQLASSHDSRTVVLASNSHQNADVASCILAHVVNDVLSSNPFRRLVLYRSSNAGTGGILPIGLDIRRQLRAYDSSESLSEHPVDEERPDDQSDHSAIYQTVAALASNMHFVIMLDLCGNDVGRYWERTVECIQSILSAFRPYGNSISGRTEISGIDGRFNHKLLISTPSVVSGRRLETQLKQYRPTWHFNTRPDRGDDPQGLSEKFWHNKRLTWG